MRQMVMAITGLALILTACSTAHHVEIKPFQRGGPVIKPGQDAYTEAKKQLEAGHPALALDGFRQALRSSSQTIDALNGLAVAYDRLGRFDLSRRFYELALAADPTNEKVLHNVAVSLRMSGAEKQWALENAAPVPTPVVQRAEVQSERVSPGEIIIKLEDPKPVAPEQASVKAETTMAFKAEERREHMERLSPGEVVVKLEAAKPVAPAQENLKTEKLLVLNAVGRPGQAGRMRRYLAGVGWVDARIGNAKMRLQRSVLLYPRGSREAAERLAANLPFAYRMVQGQRVSRIVLMLGRNASRFDNGLRTRA